VDTDIHHDEVRHKFVARLGGREAYVRYVRSGRTLKYTSTFVPSQHRHHGVGARLVEHALDYANEHGFEVVPSCPFVKWVADRNPAYRSVLAPPSDPTQPSG
jgi:predicted GNAT family acetyltransferase